jgi:hypothetical protein
LKEELQQLITDIRFLTEFGVERGREREREMKK